MSDPNTPNNTNTPNDYPTTPGYPGPQPSSPPQPSYPQPEGYPPQPGYPQQPATPPPYTPPPYTPPPATPPPYQPSPVQQPGYPQLPQGGYPPYPYAPPPQPQNSNRGLFIGCGIALAVVLLICGGLSVAAYIGAQRAGDAVRTIGTAATASLVVTEFCSDMQSQSYGQAYGVLSSSVQSRQTQPQFVQAMQERDTNDGAVQLCTEAQSNALPTVSGRTATIQIQVARGDPNNVKTGTLTLVEEGNDWRVDSADSSLDLF